MNDQDPREEMRKISRRSLIWAGASLIGGYAGYRLLAGASREGMLPAPFRIAEGTNADVWEHLFRDSAIAPTFSPSQRTANRVNGLYGLGQDFDPAKWTLSVENVHGSNGPLVLTIDDIKALPRHEFTTQLCCIEGWNIVITWTGARFRDFAEKYPPPSRTGEPSLERPGDLVPYVSMATPDRSYYIGLDMASALHPQTLLAYEMNGEPLSLEHGAPIRLAIPTKYGIKNIKRIGTIRYMEERPEDYWAKQGYDWFAGL